MTTEQETTRRIDLDIPYPKIDSTTKRFSLTFSTDSENAEWRLLPVRPRIHIHKTNRIHIHKHMEDAIIEGDDFTAFCGYQTKLGAGTCPEDHHTAPVCKHCQSAMVKLHTLTATVDEVAK